MNITLYTVGKIKESFYRSAIDEYRKRLGRYCRLDIVEVADEPTPDAPGPGERRRILDTEGSRLLTRIRESEYVIALAIDGTRMDSVAFSKQLEDLALHGRSDIAFVIGGSLGLSDAVLSRADLCLSFSDMTFPHPLMRVILLEQVYRAFRIQRGEPYHK